MTQNEGNHEEEDPPITQNEGNHEEEYPPITLLEYFESKPGHEIATKLVDGLVSLQQHFGHFFVSC